MKLPPFCSLACSHCQNCHLSLIHRLHGWHFLNDFCVSSLSHVSDSLICSFAILSVNDYDIVFCNNDCHRLNLQKMRTVDDSFSSELSHQILTIPSMVCDLRRGFFLSLHPHQFPPVKETENSRLRHDVHLFTHLMHDCEGFGFLSFRNRLIKNLLNSPTEPRIIYQESIEHVYHHQS